jgi:hypothetical protein
MATDLQEALTAAGASALIQKQIDPVLLEYVRRYSPLVRALPTVKWSSNVYYFNQRTALVPGGFVTDGGARPVGTSTYVQNSFNIKLLQSVGAVTGYAQAVTSDLIGNLRATEIEGAARELLWDIETAIDWGNSASTLLGPYPQFDGLDTQVATFSGTSQNAINYGTSTTTTSAGSLFSTGVLDELIDLVESNVAMPVETTDWMFVMSPTANSKLSQLLINQQRYNDVVTVAAGLIVPTYRNIPIIKSSFLSPRTLSMNAITLTKQASGGSMTTGNYWYTVSAILNTFGETLACSDVEITSVASNGTVTISFTPPTGPDPSSSPTLYKVFRTAAGGAQATETLLGYCDAAVADQFGNVYQVNQIIDTGATLSPGYYNGSSTQANYGGTVAAYVGTNSNIYPLASGDGNIYLMSRDPNFIVRPFVRDICPIDVYPTTASPDSLPFAMVSDTTLAIRAPQYLGRAAKVNTGLTT